MPTDSVEEWRRLTALYSEMGDIEIQDLADQINDLTPTAQDVLRDELKKRRLSAASTAPGVRTSPHRDDAEAPWDHEHDSDADPDADDSGEETNYTWKVGLSRCESLDEASARSEMLRRAGIDSWIQHPGTPYIVQWLEVGVGDFQINVAADQLGEAQTILEQPIPSDIMEQIREQNAAPQYEIPTCPACGAPDPTLESVEPSNNWLCESCGHTWSDPAADHAASESAI